MGVKNITIDVDGTPKEIADFISGLEDIVSAEKEANQDTTIRDVLARNIREYRQKFKMTRAELSKKIGVSEAAIGQYERGERTAQISVLCKLADVFNVPVDILAGRGNYSYDIVMDYRTNKANEFVRSCGYEVKELPDGTISLFDNDNKAPIFTVMEGVVEVADELTHKQYRPALSFRSHEDYLSFVENIMQRFLRAENSAEILTSTIARAKENKSFLPVVAVTLGTSYSVATSF